MLLSEAFVHVQLWHVQLQAERTATETTGDSEPTCNNSLAKMNMCTAHHSALG